MKFRLRTLLIIIAVVSVLLALPTFIYTTVMPANRMVNERLTQAIGKRFEETGLLPQSPYVSLDDLPELVDLRLEQVENGDLYNRWGELIDISSVGTGEFDGKKVISLSVSSTGPYGLGYNSLNTTFEYEIE